MTTTTNQLSKHAIDFINEERLHGLLDAGPADPVAVREAIAKAMAKEPLTVEETASLLRATDPELVEEIYAAPLSHPDPTVDSLEIRFLTWLSKGR